MKYVPAWFPGANFRRLGLQTQELIKKMINVPFDMVKRQVVRSSVPFSVFALSCRTTPLAERRNRPKVVYCESSERTARRTEQRRRHQMGRCWLLLWYAPLYDTFRNVW